MGEILKLAEGEVLETIIANEKKSLKFTGSNIKLYNISLRCIPKKDLDAQIAVYVEIGAVNPLIAQNRRWIIKSEDYASNESAFKRYKELEKKIKDGKYKLNLSFNIKEVEITF